VMILLFRLFLTSAEAAALLNTVDEEQRQPPADAVFQGLQNRHRDLFLIFLAEISQG
jgi:hypothetical protein